VVLDVVPVTEQKLVGARRHKRAKISVGIVRFQWFNLSTWFKSETSLWQQCNCLEWYFKDHVTAFNAKNGIFNITW